MSEAVVDLVLLCVVVCIAMLVCNLLTLMVVTKLYTEILKLRELTKR